MFIVTIIIVIKKNNVKYKPSRVERLSRSILQLILPPVQQNKP